MDDRQQLAAIGEHMREMEECKQKKHSAKQVMAWAGDYEKIGGHGLIVEMLKSYAGMLDSSQSKPEFKVPDGWMLVPEVPTNEMIASGGSAFWNDNKTTFGMYRAMILAAPEYNP